MKVDVPALSPGLEPRTTPLPGARLALILLLVINLFNYMVRRVARES